MTAQLAKEDFLKVELPDGIETPELKDALKDIALILESSGANKYIEIGLPKPR